MIKNILLDLDGVCADFFSAALDRLNHATGKSITYDKYMEYPCYEMESKFGLTRDEFWSIIDRGRFWQDLKPFYWTKDLYRMLSSIAPVTIASSPSPWLECVPQKLLWVKDYLGLQKNLVYLGRENI